MIRSLNHDNGEPLKHAERWGEELKTGIRQAAKEAGLEVLVTGHGACFWLHFTSAASIANHRDIFDRRLRLMLDEGIYLLPERRMYLSAAHTEEDVAQTLAAVQRVFT